MTLRAWGSGPLTLADIQNEFGGATSTSLNEYYAGTNNGLGLIVRSGVVGYPGGVSTPIPSSANRTISIANFFGATAYQTGSLTFNGPWNTGFNIWLPYYVTIFTVTLQGGGGGGGGGAAEGNSNGNNVAGGGGGGPGATTQYTMTANRFGGNGQLIGMYIGGGGQGAIIRTTPMAIFMFLDICLF